MTNNLRTFFALYVANLKDAMTAHPADYGFTSAEQATDHICALTANAMLKGFQVGTYNKDGRAIRATCKALGLKHTYTVINAFLKAA